MTSRQPEEEIPMELEEETAGTAEAGPSQTTASSDPSVSPAKPGLHPESVVDAVAGSIREGGKSAAAMDDEEKPDDHAKLTEFLSNEGLSEETIQKLNEEGFNSLYAFSRIKREDVDSMNLHKRDRGHIIYIAEEVKPKTSARDFTPACGKSSVTKKKKRKVAIGTASVVCQNVSGTLNLVSQTEYVAPSVHSYSHYTTVSAEAAEKHSRPKKVKSDKSSQVTDFRNWLKSLYITDKTLKSLIEEGFDSFLKLLLIEEMDVEDLGVNRAQRRLVTEAVQDLKTRKENREFPFSDGGDDCDSVEMGSLRMCADNVTGEVNAVKQERFISDKPIQQQNFYGPVSTGILGNVAPGASVGNIQVGATDATGGEETFPVVGISPEGPLCDRALSELAGSLAAEWYHLGCQLGVPAVKLDQLRMDNPHSVHRQSFGALRLWRNSLSGHGSDEEKLGILIRCLRQIDRKDLAEGLSSKGND